MAMPKVSRQLLLHDLLILFISKFFSEILHYRELRRRYPSVPPRAGNNEFFLLAERAIRSNKVGIAGRARPLSLKTRLTEDLLPSDWLSLKKLSSAFDIYRHFI